MQFQSRPFPHLISSRTAFIAAATLLSLFYGSPAVANPPAPEHWTGTWGSSQTAPYGTEVLSKGVLQNATLREVVHLSIGGSRLRLHLSNAFGGTPLVLRSVHVALRNAANTPGSIEQASDHPASFNGHSGVSIPAGAEYLTDPIDMRTAALSDLVITMTIENPPEIPTLHAGARATSFLLPGDHATDARFASPQTFTRWYFLAGVEVAGDKEATAVITLGDSITDGHGATTDGNDRWPDVLARKLAADKTTQSVGVVNQGIGGNRILQDGIGPNALARFDRDVLSVPGARCLIILEGINDLGTLDRTEDHPQAVHDAQLASLKSAFRQMVDRAHAHGLRVIGATLTPYVGSGYYHPSALSEGDRLGLNQWIRTSGVFDDVVDLDAVVRDPAHPSQLLPETDSGDHLHPGPAGYKRMGEAFPTKLFK